MPAKGAEAQAAEAKRRAEKRAAKGAGAVRDEEFKKAMDVILVGFKADSLSAMREEISTQMSKIKAENTTLREAAEKAQKTSESRRLELDGQVDRARRAEKQLQDNAGEVRDMKTRAAQEIKAVKDGAEAEIKRSTEIIEEQSSTIRAQARALREAERAAKV